MSREFTTEELERIKEITNEICDKSKKGSVVFTGEYFLSWRYSPVNEAIIKKVITRIKEEFGFNIIINRVEDNPTPAIRKEVET